MEPEIILNSHDFYFEKPLYEIVNINQLEANTFKNDVDAYSAKNNSETTYQVFIEDIDTWNVWISPSHIPVGFYLVTLKCKRKNNDDLRFFIYKDTKIAMKVGQLPSLADLQFSEIGKKYDKILGKEDLKNFKKAIGLVSHCAGAGSFVYLRRIFENLIIETYKNNSSILSISEDKFKQKTMEEKVELLKQVLPKHLVEMRFIYGILSKGVHELSEEECLKLLGPLKLSIELVLDQKIVHKKNKEKDDMVKKQVHDIQQQLSSVK